MSKTDDFSANGPLIASLRRSDQRETDLAVAPTQAETLTASDVAELRRVVDSLTARTSPDVRRVVIKAGRRIVFLDTAEIDWIEAYGNYVRFHAGKESYAVRSGIGQLADRLDPGEFVRIHRSTVVNVRKIKELEPCDNGEYIVVLKDGKQLSCSRGYAAGLQQLVKQGYTL